MADHGLDWRWRSVQGQPLPYLNCLRDTVNDGSAYPPDRVRYPDGKLQFDRFVVAHGGRAPETLARIDQGAATPPGAAPMAVQPFLASLRDGSYFCKPDYGRNGEGVIRLDKKGGSVTVDGIPQSLSCVESVVTSQPYLIQDSLVPLQHRRISRFNDRVLNTVRVIIFDTADGPKAISAFMRFANDAPVDNWERGGVAVAFDVKTGRLVKTGFTKFPPGVVDRHQRSQLAFDGETIPHWQNAIALACTLQASLPIKTVGWDIAFLQDGPCIIEANRTWSTFTSHFQPALLQAILDYHLPAEPESTSRFELSGDFRDRNRVRLWLSCLAGKALASGRIDDLSDERLVFTLAGSRRSTVFALNFTKKWAAAFRLDRVKKTPIGETIRKGMDVSASYRTALEPYARDDAQRQAPQQAGMT